MKNININFESNQVTILDKQDKQTIVSLDSEEGFTAISQAMLRTGWDNKYVYSFSWLGRPVIQLPDDMIRIQELIYKVQPDVIIETGVAHGGSLVFYASLLHAIGKGKVVGIDIDIRSHNRAAIEEHKLFPYINLIEGSSIDEKVVNEAKNQIKPDDVVLIFLDACHTKEHVLQELAQYSPLVSKNSYIVAMDGIMKDLVGAPRSDDDWAWNNPTHAAIEFVEKNKQFTIEEQIPPFNEGNIKAQALTYWPNAYIKRIK